MGPLTLADLSLLPLARGLLAAYWDVTDNNRKARYYELTKTGGVVVERAFADAVPGDLIAVLVHLDYDAIAAAARSGATSAVA